VITSAFIDSLSDIPGLERYSNLKLGWSQDTLMNPEGIKEGDVVYFDRDFQNKTEFRVLHVGTAQELLPYDYTGLLEEGLQRGDILPDTLCAHLKEVVTYPSGGWNYDPIEFVNVINELQKVEQKVE